MSDFNQRVLKVVQSELDDIRRLFHDDAPNAQSSVTDEDIAELKRYLDHITTKVDDIEMDTRNLEYIYNEVIGIHEGQRKLSALCKEIKREVRKEEVNGDNKGPSLPKPVLKFLRRILYYLRLFLRHVGGMEAEALGFLIDILNKFLDDPLTPPELPDEFPYQLPDWGLDDDGPVDTSLAPDWVPNAFPAVWHQDEVASVIDVISRNVNSYVSCMFEGTTKWDTYYANIMQSIADCCVTMGARLNKIIEDVDYLKDASDDTNTTVHTIDDKISAMDIHCNPDDVHAHIGRVV